MLIVENVRYTIFMNTIYVNLKCIYSKPQNTIYSSRKCVYQIYVCVKHTRMALMEEKRNEVGIRMKEEEINKRASRHGA